MSAPYSSRASVIMAAMRVVLPATSPTGKSNWARAMRRCWVMSDSMRQEVQGSEDGEAVGGQVRELPAEHLDRHVRDLRSVHHHRLSGDHQGRHQPGQQRPREPGGDQGYDRTGFGDLDQVALDVQPAGNGTPRRRVGIGIHAELAHAFSEALNLRTWSLARPSRAMR